MDSQEKIAQELGELRGEMREGFRQLTARFDELSTKVATHEKRLNDGDKVIDEVKPVLMAVRSAGWLKSFMIGTASFFAAVGGVVVGLAWIVKQLAK